MSVKSPIHRVLIAKPGLDGHDRGAKIIVRALRDAGFEVIYTGIRCTPEEIAKTAIAEDVAAIGLSSLSGGHRELFPAVIKCLKGLGEADIPVIGGGIIPEEDFSRLRKAGVVEIFTSGTELKLIVETFSRICTAKKHPKGLKSGQPLRKARS